MEKYGSWDLFKHKVRAKWGKLTDDDLTQIDGSRKQLVERLEFRYGWKTAHAEEVVRQFERKLK